MMRVKIKVDKSRILEKLTNNPHFVQKGWIKAEKIINKKFNKAKDIFFRDFAEHEVTKEIVAGPGASNSSGLLGGYGNLFSFFGFNDGEDPISDVTFYMQTQFHVIKGSYRAKQWNFRISMPDKEEVENFVVKKYGADYTTESWIRGVEKGYSGLNYYLPYYGIGRSGGGTQNKNPVRELNFSTTKYLSVMIDGFKRNIKKK